MRIGKFIQLMIVALLLVGFYGCRMSSREPVDLVIINAKILTIDEDNPMAEAVAFQGEWIVAVGMNDEIKNYIVDGETEVIDARGRLLIPGFNDAHTHFDAVDPDFIDLRYITDTMIILERVREKASQVKPGELIRGGRWEHEMFSDKKWPTKDLIDPYTPDNPVVLSRADGHSFLVNSYVLKHSGITKETPDPDGGEIQKDSVSGEPTGILKESARLLIKTGEVAPELTAEEEEERLERGWEAAFRTAAGLGVTTVHVVTSSRQTEGQIDPSWYRRFQENGRLPLRLYFSGVLTADETRLREYQSLREQYPLSDNWIRFGMLKGFIDGTLGSGTMLVFEPFADSPGNTGLPQMPYQELEKRVTAADAAGFQVAIHAIGDKANHWVLNAFESAREANGIRDSRHRSEHAQILTSGDIPRFSQLGVIASMQPTHCITDKRFAEKRIGLERCNGAYAWRSLLKSGARMAFGTDYSVEPLNPMEGLYAAVTRKDREGEEGEGWFPGEKLTMEEAIELYTVGSAYAEFMEDRKGKIKPGYLGDAVLLDRDLLTIPEEEIMQTQVVVTLVGGKVVYSKE